MALALSEHLEERAPWPGGGDSWIEGGAVLQPRDLCSSFSCNTRKSNVAWVLYALGLGHKRSEIRPQGVRAVLRIAGLPHSTAKTWGLWVCRN